MHPDDTQRLLKEVSMRGRFQAPTSALLCSLSLTSIVFAAEPPEPIPVFVGAVRGLPEMSAAEGRAFRVRSYEELKRRAEAEKELEKQLKKQHGKDPERWPTEVRARYEEAGKATLAASDAWLYGSNTQTEVDEVAKKVAGHFAKRDLVRLVDDDSKAIINVTVLRFALGTIPRLRARIAVRAELASAIKLDAKALEGMIVLTPYSDASPHWDIEVWATEMEGFGSRLAGVVSQFVKHNHATLRAAAGRP